MGIGPCILTKVCCAFWRTSCFPGEAEDGWVIGMAMVGRAEFAYLIAQLAQSSGMMSKEVFSVVVWALLYATVFAPLAFRKILERFSRDKALGANATDAEKAKWDEEHNFSDFRQSGHLPVLHDDHATPAVCPECGNAFVDDSQFCRRCGTRRQGGQRPHEAKRDDHAVQHAEMQHESVEAVKERNANKPVTSEANPFSEDVRHELDKFNNHSAAPHEHNDPQFDKFKEALDVGNGPGARGSGFLCCLFFRKIIIM